MQGTRWTTINAKVHRMRRTVFTTPRETEFLNGDNVKKINDEILMLVETRNVIPKKRNKDETLDQRVDPSNIAMMNVDNVKENLEHVLSIVEYEPRKINNKEKRKIMNTFSDNLGKQEMNISFYFYYCYFLYLNIKIILIYIITMLIICYYCEILIVIELYS